MPLLKSAVDRQTARMTPYKMQHEVVGELQLTSCLRHGMSDVNVVNVYGWHRASFLRDRRQIMNKKRLAKIGYVAAAGASFLFSISLWFTGSKQEGMFVGLWVPSILSFGTLVLGSTNHAK